MKPLAFLLPLGLIAGCVDTGTQANNNAVTYGATGALIGAAVADDDDRLQGAALGGAAGLAAATLLGPSNTQGNCVYRNSRGQRIVAPC